MVYYKLMLQILEDCKGVLKNKSNKSQVLEVTGWRESNFVMKLSIIINRISEDIFGSTFKMFIIQHTINDHS